ncbi:MAG: bifunctional phosphoribosylaminoimidazolecarboxamide formyltransferase/IMP cyclohydrolase [Tissierellia bacterium]|nr:bifunctional phosphoribosylaminoimidazolecarboxamide formyltransferase/IMP cyclohydrolase [Tissierellia bacterium]
MRALISVYDKTGLEQFAKDLIELGWEILSTGGSYRYLKEHGISVEEVSDYTKFPEIIGGRVKTLHPKIHGGILYRRGIDDDETKNLAIEGIDMVVNNLYPFEECLREGGEHPLLMDQIDIGGPAMIRAAAKNYMDVYILTDPKDYGKMIDILKSEKEDRFFRLQLAQKAFQKTSSYDGIIASYFNRVAEDDFPEILTKSYYKKKELRYGENPHQKAAYYEDLDPTKIHEIRVLQGKELSYNNINDIYSAVKINKEFKEICAVAVKHTNPCGIALGKNGADAFEKCRQADPESIFGGIVVINTEIDKKCANQLQKIFLEIVVAPAFHPEALEILSNKKNLRLIEIPDFHGISLPSPKIREVFNGVLVQEKDDQLFLDNEFKIVTNRRPSVEELEEALFAWRVVKNVASNGVVITKDRKTLGIGQGETKRSWAVEEAIERAGDDIQGGVFASDGFFFRDTMELLYKAGVKMIIQPGGSIKDQEVIDFANEHDMSIVFTSIRHFRH